MRRLRASSAWQSSTSRTTWRSSRRSPTASPSCTPGDIVEEGPMSPASSPGPRHPYSRGLVSSDPRPRSARRLRGIPGVAVGPRRARPMAAPSRRAAISRSAACEERGLRRSPVGNDRSVRCIRWELTPAPSFVPRASSRRPRPPRPPLLRVANLRAVYGGAHATRGCRRRCLLRRRARRVRRAGRRVGQRQDDDRALRRRAARSGRRHDPARRRGARARAAARTASSAAGSRSSSRTPSTRSTHASRWPKP